MGIFKIWASGQKGLKYKLMLAFSLMSIIPLLACMYIISVKVFPNSQDIINVSAIVLAALLVAILGLLLARGLVDPVIDMAIEAKVIASGNYDRRISVATDDEVGALAGSINLMTQKIKTNLDELKNYGQKMKEINVDIHKKVLALSSLLQIGDIISSGSIQIDSLLDMAVERISAVLDGGFAAFYIPREEGGDFILKTSSGVASEKLTDLVIKESGSSPIEKALANHTVMMIDKSTRLSKDTENFISELELTNLLGIPIYSGRKNLGMLLLGSKFEETKYKNDDVELIKVFAKQITIAIESDMLNKKTEALAIKDDLTGLFNKNFIVGRLEEEIKRAIFYQRPCSFVIFNIDNFKDFRDKHGELVAEEILKRISKLIKDNLDPIGKAARIGGDEFAILLPEKNKKEAAEIATSISVKIASTPLTREGQVNTTVSAGVSENPIDGSTADELLKRAIEAVKTAKSSGKNKVVA